MNAIKTQWRPLFPGENVVLSRLPRMLTRSTFALFGIVACLFIFSACQSTSGTKTELTFSTWGSAQEIVVLKTLISQFEHKHPSVHVKLLHIPDNYFQKLHLLIAGGLAPDVMFVNSINYPVYASHGLFKDLSSSISKTNFYPQALATFQWPKQSKTPILGAVPRDISNLVIYYNRSWFKRKNIPDPAPNWTWQHFIDIGKRLNEDQNHDGIPERFGVSFYVKPPLFWLPFVWSANGQLLSPDRKQLSLTTPQALQGLHFIQDLRWKYHIAPRQVESGGTNMSQLFLQEKIAMLVSGRWSVPVFREQATFDWDIVPLPIGPSEKSRVGIDASGYAVSATSKHSKEAIAFVQFMTSKKAIETITESGLIVPARKDVANSPLFLESHQKPFHSHYFTSIIADGIPTQTPSRWNEFSEELMLSFQPVWDGEKSPEAVLNSSTISHLNQILGQEGHD